MENTGWSIEEYNQWIQNGCPQNDNVLELNVYCSKLISLVNLQNLVNLKKLDCTHNKLTTLNGIQNLTNLQELYCHDNHLTTLNDIQHLINLKQLNCSYNNLVNLNGIQNLTNLQILECYKNKINTLNHIQNLVNLEILHCYDNNITTLNGIQNLTNLQKLYFSNNNITTLNDLQNLNRLTQINYSNNPIDHIPPNIMRMLNQIKNGQNIYDDSQNVHNHHIQESIKQSILNILKLKPTITNLYEIIINDTILTEQTKRLLFEYATCKDVHTTLNITFEELLLYVFDRIEQNEHKDEIKRVLNIEMDDSVCKCFTGRISRLINCLNGFDPFICINISDSEQISQIIILIRNELDRTNSYSTIVHKQLVESRLKELKYSNDVIDIWIQNIE
jgi:Leucine-rich repeat (LRR) protein